VISAARRAARRLLKILAGYGRFGFGRSWLRYAG
jgi:hypothetical protein